MTAQRDERERKNAYLKEWRKKNPERVYQLNERHKPPSIKDMSEDERAFVRERARAYYQKNKARIQAYQKQYKKDLKKEMTERKIMVECSIASRFKQS